MYKDHGDVLTRCTEEKGDRTTVDVKRITVLNDSEFEKKKKTAPSAEQSHLTFLHQRHCKVSLDKDC